MRQPVLETDGCRLEAVPRLLLEVLHAAARHDSEGQLDRPDISGSQLGKYINGQPKRRSHGEAATTPRFRAYLATAKQNTEMFSHRKAVLKG